LKKWSSFTPLVPRKNNSSRGGGHFFTWNGKGFVVDPGPNFIDNFFEKGFKMSDIDCVICSHGHIDHTQDLERIITLLYERNEMGYQQKIRLVLSPGCASKYGSLLSASSDVIDSCIVLYADRNIKINDWQISFRPILSNHNELFSRKDTALSFIIELHNQDDTEYRIGFTNDTGYIGKNKKIETFFNCDLDILVVNLGSDSFARLTQLASTQFPKPWLRRIKKEEDIYKVLKDPIVMNTLGYKSFKHLEKYYFNNQKTKDYDWYNTHLGYRGLLRLAMNSNYKYLIVTEFGEELKNYRHLFAKSLNKTLGKGGRIVTGDIGTKFKLENKNVFPFCDVRNEFYDNEIIEKVVKNQDFRVIHFNKDILSKSDHKKELQNMFGYLI
jgi:L-ascorbate metabolism protein UlaG (beta-lactamase superfamily)